MEEMQLAGLSGTYSYSYSYYDYYYYYYTTVLLAVLFMSCCFILDTSTDIYVLVKSGGGGIKTLRLLS